MYYPRGGHYCALLYWAAVICILFTWHWSSATICIVLLPVIMVLFWGAVIMLYSIVKACLGAASEETAHSNMALPSASPCICLDQGLHTSSTHKCLKTNLTSTLQSDTQRHWGETGFKGLNFSELWGTETFDFYCDRHNRHIYIQYPRTELQYRQSAAYVYNKLLQCETQQAQGNDM